jgi:hypothetical protein
MSHVPKHIADAAFTAHIEVASSLTILLGRKPTYREVAHTLAEAFGDAMGIYAGSGAQPHQVNALNRIAQRAYETMLSDVMVCDCEGSA